MSERRREDLDSPISAERLQAIYSSTAAFYDGLVAENQSGPKLAAIEMLGRRRGERFLEVGVGTAWAFARVVAATGIEGAYGLDLAPGMLDVAAGRLRDEGSVEQAPLLLGDGRALPFCDGSFDCVLNTYTLEVLPAAEMGALLSECGRVLTPGGRLVLVNLTDGEGADASMTEEWRRGFAADPEYFGGARPIHAQPLLASLGFREIERRYMGPAWPSEVIRALRPG